MGSNKNRGVFLKVDGKFFDKVFERERKKLENRLKKSSGIEKRLSQMEFTRLLHKNNVQFKMDKFMFGKKKKIIKRKKR